MKFGDHLCEIDAVEKLKYKLMTPKIIHTKTFSCADDHPIV